MHLRHILGEADQLPHRMERYLRVIGARPAPRQIATAGMLGRQLVTDKMRQLDRAPPRALFAARP